MDELNDPDAAGSGDAESLTTDLTPRVAPAGRRRRRSPWAPLALVAIVIALLVVVLNGLGDATLFFRNADEAVAQRDTLGDRRFRVQGRVQADSIRPTSTGVDFVIAHGGTEVTIVHQGDPPDLFQENIPVVLEGHWAQVGDEGAIDPVADLVTAEGWYFASDRFFVKHEEVYVEEHPDRTDDYVDDDAGERTGEDGGTPAP